MWKRPFWDVIFVIFSPQRKFLDKFFSTQKCVITTKLILRQNWCFQENIINFACMATFSTSHTYQMFRISDFSTSVMGRHLKFFISLQSSYTESWKFSTWQFFLHMYNLWYLWQISGLDLWQNYLFWNTIVQKDIFIREVNMFGKAGITNLHSPTKRVMKSLHPPTKGALWVGIFTVTNHGKFNQKSWKQHQFVPLAL